MEQYEIEWNEKLNNNMGKYEIGHEVSVFMVEDGDYLNKFIHKTINGRTYEAEMYCMPGQCSTVIAAGVDDSEVWYDMVMEAALDHDFSAIIVTDNAPLDVAVSKGFRLFSTHESIRTGSTIYQYIYEY